ncbi:hypothetical protein L9F63_001475 [Diploptera punctata]|uniref:Nucleoside diphosphate kinase n=1 Tax=Diploptera punctata TaxID=6984 RepID=A0AAD8A413_DIPPU|nr:hypothetical protein L9F63_001475 [Diploptera punctata]
MNFEILGERSLITKFFGTQIQGRQLEEKKKPVCEQAEVIVQQNKHMSNNSDKSELWLRMNTTVFETAVSWKHESYEIAMQRNVNKSLQLTMAIIKPHITKAPHALKKIHDIIITNEFYVVKRRILVMTEDLASSFYAEHRNKFFYNRLVTFMCSGSSEVYILARWDAIKVWRELMGPTKVYQAQYTAPDSIRGSFGLSDTRNATHGSDSPESALREIAIFFPNFDVNKWFDEEEKHFIGGNVTLCPEQFVHQINRVM